MAEAQPATVAEMDRFFREVVLCLAGIFAVRDCEDDIVRQVTRSLGHVYRRHRRRLLRQGSGNAKAARRPIEPHPAVEELLAQIGR